MLSPETILQGRYRIVRQLGQGGMGAVYEAVDERLDTIVALKETLFTDEKLRKQFEREARLLARLHHQALPRVSDHFNEGDGQFLVMQYVAGDDLAEMLAARNAPFPPDEVLRWADQLCDALDYLHTQEPQIIHRDIKPQNLKLTARGQIVLLDFGLAKGSAGQLTAVTTSASIFGYTPNYAPLEQVQGMGTDPRSDIYALGATLYHLMTNVKPPDALSRAGAVVNGQADPLLAANEVNPAVSQAVAHVLGKSMSQKRDDRFASAGEMRHAFTVAVNQPAGEAATVLMGAANASAAPTPSSDQATKITGAQTQRGSVEAYSASEAKTLVAGDGTNVTATPADVPTVVRPKSQPNSRRWLAAAIVLIVIGGGAAGFYAYRARMKNQTISTQPAQTSTQAAPNELQNNQPTTSPALNQAETAKSEQMKAEKSEKTEKAKSAEAAQRATTSTKKAETSKTEAIPPPSPPKPAEQTHDQNRDQNRGRDANQSRPGQFDPFRDNQGKQPGHPKVPEVKELPNGGRMITNPDGTKIWIGPKGQTRVITPGTQPRRRPTPQP